jgi:uncharacterized protein YqeY
MLIDRIKEDRLLALRARDELKKNLLGTLVAAATKDGKTPDDAAVLKTIRSFLKSLDETAGLLEARGLDTGVQRAERSILSAYLPRTLGEEALHASIIEIVAALPERSPKAMGQVMAALKARHGDALDSKIASGLVRAALA